MDLKVQGVQGVGCRVEGRKVHGLEGLGGFRA